MYDERGLGLDAVESHLTKNVHTGPEYEQEILSPSEEFAVRKLVKDIGQGLMVKVALRESAFKMGEMRTILMLMDVIHRGGKKLDEEGERGELLERHPGLNHEG